MTNLHRDGASAPGRRKAGRLRMRLVQVALAAAALAVLDARFLGGSMRTQATLEAENGIQTGRYLVRRTMERLRNPG